MGDPVRKWDETVPIHERFWSDEPKTKNDATELALKQIVWLLERKHLEVDKRIRLLAIVSRWVDKIEVSPAEKGELINLLKSQARKQIHEEPEVPGDASNPSQGSGGSSSPPELGATRSAPGIREG